MQTRAVYGVDLNDEVNRLTPALSGARAAGGGIFGCQLRALVRAGDLSYEELTLFYLSRIREIESDREISECRDQSESCVRRESAGTHLAGRGS